MKRDVAIFERVGKYGRGDCERSFSTIFFPSPSDGGTALTACTGVEAAVSERTEIEVVTWIRMAYNRPDVNINKHMLSRL